ncbi:MAG: BON domain-containing protein, partial [Alphaproteobacteria bacterium]|nr:BON domain-containing protein [Alphaproteobacteria bacterium]
MHIAMRLLAVTALTTSLSACATPVLIGAAATGAYVGLQERSAEQVAKDTKVKIHIKDRLVGKNYKYLNDIGVTVFEGDVLLTGIVPDKEKGEEVLKIAQTTPETERVYNELFVGAAYTASQKAKDTWIAAQIKPRLIGNKETFPINYSTDVVNGHVFIIGYVSSFL